jgi:hypothetical protein
MFSLVITIFTTLLLVLGYYFLFQLGLYGVKILTNALGAKNRRPIDVSYLRLTPPANFDKTINTLSDLGFIRLGEASVSINGSQTNAWLFVSTDKLITAEVIVSAPIFISFTTIYNNTSVVETSFPVGETIETPFFISHTIKSSIEKAYFHQKQQILNFSNVHGSPCNIENMHDYLRWDVVYRENHVSRKFRRFTLSGIVYILLLGYGVISALIVIGFYIVFDGLGGSLTLAKIYSYLTTLFFIITPSVLIGAITLFVSTWSRDAEAKPA